MLSRYQSQAATVASWWGERLRGVELEPLPLEEPVGIATASHAEGLEVPLADILDFEHRLALVVETALTEGSGQLADDYDNDQQSPGLVGLVLDEMGAPFYRLCLPARVLTTIASGEVVISATGFTPFSRQQPALESAPEGRPALEDIDRLFLGQLSRADYDRGQAAVELVD